MSNVTADGLAAADDPIGPLEQKHLQFANYRAVTDGTKVSKTHWHIATANALGWGFDGMDGVIFALVSPMVIKEFSLTVPEYRSGLQIALFVGIAGLYFWPWLSDRLGRRTLLAVNIALFSLLMPVVALSPTFAVFVVARSLVGFALNGEWSLGSMLVAETWPARLRGRVISVPRSTWCLGASLAGGITGLVAADFGWRTAVMVPGVIALLAIYVRATCPESPYWVRAGPQAADCQNAAGRAARHAGGVVRGVLQHLHFQHGRLDAAVSGDREALVDGGIQHLLYVLGYFRLPRPLRGGLAGRQDRPPAGVRGDADRGRGLHHAVGHYRKSPAAVGVRPRLELWLPRLLGTEHNSHRGSGSYANSRRRQWRGLGDRLFRRFCLISVCHRRAAAAHRIVRAVVPVYSRADGGDGDRRDDDGARAFRQGGGRNYRVSKRVRSIIQSLRPPGCSPCVAPGARWQARPPRSIRPLRDIPRPR